MNKKLLGLANYFSACTIGLSIAATLAPSDAMGAVIIYEGAGATPAAITTTRDAFRAAVGGGSVAAANGDFGGLRREINWDGVPDAFADPTLLPGNFFNSNSPRGATFSTPGTGFLVSANAGFGTPLFGFPGDLQTFSAQRLFGIVSSNVMDINFFVPGTNTPATTSAFGAIFVDVEDSNQTKLEFFDQNQVLLLTRFAIAGPNQGLSFVGGVADAGERISRVRITTPNNFLVSNGVRLNETSDYVVMDDFLYATPAVVPEPTTVALAGFGCLIALRRRREATPR